VETIEARAMAISENEATARYIAGNVSTQLMLKVLFEIIATMSDDPDQYRDDMKKKVLELAEEMPLNVAPEVERDVRGFVKETVTNILTNSPPLN
jgi:hypothetical protein